MNDSGSFASSSLPRHLGRGAVGFGALIGSVALVPVVGPVSLLLAAVGVLAFRGCPTCWAIGLVQTISRGRLERTCSDGVCELKVAERTALTGSEEEPRRLRGGIRLPRSSAQSSSGAAGPSTPGTLHQPQPH